MEFPKQFICATTQYATMQESVPAPYLRKSFLLHDKATSGNLLICGLGFYELWINGQRITKGRLSPYISAPDDLLYYDAYDLLPYLQVGENVIGICLGNGMLNCLGGHVWDFDKATWRSSPKVALRLSVSCANEEVVLESDESFVCSPSPIVFDDLRMGEHYDARLEQPAWCLPGFDQSTWTHALPAERPRGETVLCDVPPIVVTQTIEPISVEKSGDGYVYDFGVNDAGVCRLQIQGTMGQTIKMVHGERLVDGQLSTANIWFNQTDPIQTNTYICKGQGIEEYTPTFTYHGFRYVLVTGIQPEQATLGLLTYQVMHTDLLECGNFSCSDQVINALQDMTRRSTLSNFYHFPTDCPHREKNGWTGDAALSAEHTLLNLRPEKSYAQWLCNIRASQRADGALPGIVPTGGWGFAWGNGPAWDCVLTYLPYFTYIYRGDIEILEDNAAAIMRYVDYLSTKRDEDGLLAIGLGDWCPPNRQANEYKSPIELTDSILSMDICQKAAFIFDLLGQTIRRDFALELAKDLRESIRENLIDLDRMIALGNCQTSQAMALFYGVFEPGERTQAFAHLLKIIKRADNHIDTGILGARVIFHVLSSFGHSELAYEMIVRKDFPSYGNWVAHGATTLEEAFLSEEKTPWSLNHHFFGDISSWFIQNLAGIQLNPDGLDVDRVDIKPCFVSGLDHATAYHDAPLGKIASNWKRTDAKGSIELTIEVPDGMTGRILLPDGYVFPDGLALRKVATGTYIVTAQ